MKRRSFLKESAGAAAGAFVFPAIITGSTQGINTPGNKIQIGQIGCGRIARTHDLPGTMQHDSARIIAVSDVDRRRQKDGKELVEEFYNRKMGTEHYIDVKEYDDYKQMLADTEIDAVIISTPDHWHAQPAIEAALAGKHVYLQKPTSLTVSEGRLVSDIVHRQGIILQMGTQQRSSAQFRFAAELVRNGRIGELHTVKIGLPGDPAGPDSGEMPVPPNLNYDMWLGSTPAIPYTEMGVHPQHDYSRPGWLRIEQFGSGMITGWGQHHFDSAAWGMDTEYTGPTSIEAVAEFPKSGLWNVHGDFMVKAEFENGITMYTSGGFPNGIRYEGTRGWIFVTRGRYSPGATTPETKLENTKALNASDPSIVTSEIKEDEIHLYRSEEQHGDWLDCIRSGKQPVSPVEIGHRACTICLISHIAMKVSGVLNWDPKNEKFVNNDSANAMLSRPQRYPYGTDFIQR